MSKVNIDHTDSLSEELMNAAEYLNQKDKERGHIEEIYAHEGELFVVCQYNNFVGEYINEIFSDFVSKVEGVNGGIILTGSSGDKNRVTLIFSENPDDAIKIFTLYSIAIGTPPTTASTIAKELYDVGESENIEKIATQIHESLPNDVNYSVDEIINKIETDSNNSQSDPRDGGYSAFDM